jgi:hypothetical protein
MKLNLIPILGKNGKKHWKYLWIKRGILEEPVLVASEMN